MEANNKKDIIAGVCCLFVVAIFIYGMSNWPKYKVETDGKIWGNLYYITISSCLMFMGLIIRVAARSLFFKLCGCALYSVFFVNLFIEIKRNPMEWNFLDGLFQVPVILGIIAFETLLYLIDQKKKEKINE